MKTRDLILKFLKRNIDNWVSGEYISKELNVSRAAISKHISSLKKMGYIIESLPRKGYSLKESDLLLPDEIYDGLQTKTLGKKVVFFDETDSTNIKARDLAEEGAEEGTIVIAESQTMGRGRKGRSWYTGKGSGIFLSLILRPPLAPTEVAITTLMTAIAMVEAVKSVTKVEPKIKWPNDLLLGGKKICGILTEVSTEMDSVNYIIVGIGININTEAVSFPKEIKNIATSLHIETGEKFKRKLITQSFLKSFEKLYNILKNRNFNHIMKEWKKHSDMIGKRVEIEIFERKIKGVVEDIEDDGVLRVCSDDGSIERIISGDIHFV
ncbi:MAG: biotin--[acetyl-CoA-carboxylase] ligase [Desulfobacterales bacterium]|nr:biotin--[acetyl-CoA-carboxylase] ligase [Desulfobacterales bacterium]MCP4158589.1 biotin--[acetyl-CoA-carboxylase] ligase [Deltaproteobacteria bacterium]